MNDQNNRNNDRRPEGRQGRTILVILLAALVLTVVLNSIFSSVANAYQTEIDYSDFIEMLENDELDSVQFQSDRIMILTKEEAAKELTARQTYYTGLIDNLPLTGLTEQLEAHGVEYSAHIEETMSPILSFVLTWVLWVLVPIVGAAVVHLIKAAQLKGRIAKAGK